MVLRDCLLIWLLYCFGYWFEVLNFLLFCAACSFDVVQVVSFLWLVVNLFYVFVFDYLVSIGWVNNSVALFFLLF